MKLVLSHCLPSEDKQGRSKLKYSHHSAAPFLFWLTNCYLLRVAKGHHGAFVFEDRLNRISAFMPVLLFMFFWFFFDFVDYLDVVEPVVDQLDDRVKQLFYTCSILG
jgi:hypothetical protein